MGQGGGGCFVLTRFPNLEFLVSSVGNFCILLSVIPFPVHFILLPRSFTRLPAVSHTGACFGTPMSFWLSTLTFLLGHYTAMLKLVLLVVK